MRARLLTVLIAVGLSGISTGCFVFDELNDGEAIMEAHAPPKSAGEANKSAAGPSMGEKGAGTLDAMKGKLEEAMRREPHPDNTIVRCRIEGRFQYTRKFDCQSLGGQIVMR